MQGTLTHLRWLVAAISIAAAGCPTPSDNPTNLMPSLTRPGTLGGAHLADVDTCGACHSDIYDQQQASAHATSSFNNPIYRFAIDEFRSEVSPAASQMCGGCHDIALLVDNAMTQPVVPDDERAHAGVTCRVCHGIGEATVDGNGSYALSRPALPLPRLSSPASIENHRTAAAPIDSEALCGSCHRSFLSKDTGNDHFLAGADDLGAWKSSAYNQNGLGGIDDKLEAESCIDCHMPRVAAPLGDDAADSQGTVRSHRFLGGHTWMAAMQGNSAQLTSQAEFLKGALTVDIAAIRDDTTGTWSLPAETATAKPGDHLSIDVVVRNTKVGHSFPAGVKDAVDSWLEVRAFSADGRPIAESGDDPHAHRFRALVGDRTGTPQTTRNTHDFHGVIADHTIPARDARVVRYTLRVPTSLPPKQFPLRITAALRHRSRNLELQRQACAAANTERGRAFDRARDELQGKKPLDPCTPQPITDIATTSLVVSGQRPTAGSATWRRLYERALGLLPGLPAEAANARESLLAALADIDSARPRAQIYAALAQVTLNAPCGPSSDPIWPSCQGRLKAGLAWLAKVDALVPNHPVTARLRAALYDRAQRWDQAAAWMRIAAQAAPQNLAAKRGLARILVAAGQNDQALAVTTEGLRLAPRDGGLLRIRAAALVRTNADDHRITAAQAQARRFATPDRRTDMRARCAQIPNCLPESTLIHSHALTPTANGSQKPHHNN